MLILTFPALCEDTFTISVTGAEGTQFRGSCLSTNRAGDSRTTELSGRVPAEFKVAAQALSLTVQNLAGGTNPPEVRIGSDGAPVLDESSIASSGSWLEIDLSKNGGTIKTQRTNAPHGLISMTTAPPPGGTPISIELQVAGVHYALITFTNEVGDIEQQLVPVPFSKVFYPREGSIIGLTAQKTRVTRLDPAHADGTVEVMDDGRIGELRVVIRVNGQPVGSDQTSAPFGVASTTIKVP